MFENIFDEILPPEIINKLTWTCNDHKECKTCEYFYKSCHGLSNSTDPRNINIPKDIESYLQINWSKTDNSYIYWHRKKYYKEEFEKIMKT